MGSKTFLGKNAYCLLSTNFDSLGKVPGSYLNQSRTWNPYKVVYEDHDFTHILGGLRGPTLIIVGDTLPRSQTSLSLRKGWARKGWREGERMRDVWQILFSRWRNVQWRMITQFSKRSIDLFVLRILKEKWFFLIQCARRKLFSYNWTGYSIITGFANDLYALSMPKNYRRNPPLIC